MSKSFAFVSLTFILMLSFACNSFAKKKKILVFSKTSGFHHSSIPAGILAIQRLAMENKFVADTTTDATKINIGNLKQYAAIVFLNTTGDIFNEQQQKAFEQYIRSGGGFVGVHAATDTEFEWPWFGKLVGAYFLKHPEQQVAALNVLNRKTVSTAHLPEIWKRKDEWYNFKDISTDLKVLISIDENSYKGGTNGTNHPMAWYHDFDGGRSFYTGLGHTEESYTDPLFLQHLLGGLQYAMGVKRMEL
ncbi:ThuA domain-containing protein [Pedobacter steynii]|uniref:Crp/Fnr family transcriptional regulator n=1 Tax=Pedobacter steynii TaxID=430522 RepID=A0A1D7QHD1_9SPHI|nr:ThuA domain-containing protein [Pedobacter steynii]AOM78055.1 Crp/Fnr family transcriptional regulator [Pedobacter steynii]